MEAIKPLLVINILTSLIGSSALMLVYYQIQRRITHGDKGYKHIALAILCWLVSPTSHLFLFAESYWKDFILYAASTINNGFFLYSLYYFDLAPFNGKIHSYSPVSPRRWRNSLITGCLGIIVSFALMAYCGYNHWSSTVDGVFSILVLGLIGYTFSRSFFRRDLKGLGVFNAALISLIIPMLIYYEIHSSHDPLRNENPIFHISVIYSHVVIILVSLAMATGWVVDKFGFPNPDHMKIVFGDIKEDGRLVVTITILEGLENEEIVFPASRYLAFLKFAVRKHCNDTGLIIDRECHNNAHTRICDVIRKNKNAQKYLANKSNLIRQKWPFIFQTIRGRHELILAKENIIISPNLIENQLTTLKFEKVKNPENDIHFIQEEFKKCSTY